MTWYEFLLFVHVTAAVIWLGGAFTFQMYGAVVRHGGDVDEIARFAGLDKEKAEAACKYLNRNDVECVTMKY